MKAYLLLLLLFVSISTNAATFTARASGNWEDWDTWFAINPAGSGAGVDYPGVNDDIIIPSGFTVSVSDNNDNDGPNVGPDNFPGVCDPDNYESCTDNNFFHIGGNMTIESGGEFESTAHVMITGFVLVEGIYNLNSTSNDTFVSGEVKVVDGGSFTTGDSFSVTGNGISSVTALGTLNIGDDLFIDGDNAFVCGTGTYNLASSNAIDENIRVENGDGNALEQICVETSIQCEDDDCCSNAGACEDIYLYANCGNGDNPCTSSAPSDGTLEANEPDPSNRPFSSVVLPVEYTYFKGSVKNEAVFLEWETATEKDNDRFVIEKSSNGVGFEKTGVVLGNGDSNDLIQYTFSDYNPYNGINYYRLKQIDFDGQFEYSKMIVVYSGEVQDFQFFPNPVKNEIRIIPGNNFYRTQINIRISDLAGRFFYEELIDSEASVLTLPISLIPGIYFLQLRNDYFSQIERFVSQ